MLRFLTGDGTSLGVEALVLNNRILAELTNCQAERCPALEGRSGRGVIDEVRCRRAYLPPGCACTLHTDHRPLRKSSGESPGLWDVRPSSVYRSCSAAGCAQARSCKQEAVGRCFYGWPSAGKWVGSRPIYGVGRVAAP